MATIYRKKLKVSFLFETVVDDEGIKLSFMDEDLKEKDLSLLHHFLVHEPKVMKLLTHQLARRIALLNEQDLALLLGSYGGTPTGLLSSVLGSMRQFSNRQNDQTSPCFENIEACFTSQLINVRLEVNEPKLPGFESLIDSWDDFTKSIESKGAHCN